MSAYIVSDETISVIAKGIVDYGVEISPYEVKFNSMQLILANERYQPIGQWLLEQNYKSVNYRYKEESPTPDFSFQDMEYDEGTLYGCISCYEYQTCEIPNFEKTEIYCVLKRLEKKLITRMINQKGQEIPWGI